MNPSHETSIRNSGINRVSPIVRSAGEAIQLGDLHRKWNDNLIRHYPVIFNGKVLFRAPKETSNSWIYSVGFFGYRNRVRRYESIEAVNQLHAIGLILDREMQAVFRGEATLETEYYISDIRKLHHSVGVNPENES